LLRHRLRGPQEPRGRGDSLVRGSGQAEHLLGLLQNGTVDLTPLITHRMKLSEAPKAYDLFRSKTEGVLKIAMTP